MMNLKSVQIVGQIAVPQTVLEHRFVKEALAVVNFFQKDDERIERVIGTKNSKKCELYGWSTCVAPHTDNEGYVYLLPLNDIGSFLYTEDSEVYLQQGTVVRLNDFSSHWTFDDAPVVCAFVGAFKEPNDDQAIAILKEGINALERGDYYKAPRVREGFQVIMDDECWASKNIDDVQLMLLTDAQAQDLFIELCACCDKPATKLDSTWPYHFDNNRCNQCGVSELELGGAV